MARYRWDICNFAYFHKYLITQNMLSAVSLVKLHDIWIIKTKYGFKGPKSSIF